MLIKIIHNKDKTGLVYNTIRSFGGHSIITEQTDIVDNDNYLMTAFINDNILNGITDEVINVHSDLKLIYFEEDTYFMMTEDVNDLNTNTHENGTVVKNHESKNEVNVIETYKPYGSMTKPLSDLDRALVIKQVGILIEETKPFKFKDGVSERYDSVHIHKYADITSSLSKDYVDLYVEATGDILTTIRYIASEGAKYEEVFNLLPSNFKIYTSGITLADLKHMPSECIEDIIIILRSIGNNRPILNDLNPLTSNEMNEYLMSLGEQFFVIPEKYKDDTENSLGGIYKLENYLCRLGTALINAIETLNDGCDHIDVVEMLPRNFKIN